MKNYLIYAGIVAVAVLISAFVIKPVQNVTNQVLGGSSAPSVNGGCVEIEGVTECFASRGFTLATTTPCSIKSPVATSTLVYATLRLGVGTSTATVWSIATSTDAYSTTTPGMEFSVASGAEENLFFGTPLRSGTLQNIAPNSYVVWGLEGNALAGLASTNIGGCSAKFVIN